MSEPTTPPKDLERMERKSITIRRKDWMWLDEMIYEQRFASYSHAFRYLIEMYKRLVGVVR